MTILDTRYTGQCLTLVVKTPLGSVDPKRITYSYSRGKNVIMSDANEPPRVSAGVASKLRNKVYRMRKQKFEAALSSNSVGRALLTDPHVRNARLIHDPSSAPVYTGNRENPSEGTINMHSQSSFDSLAEHHATYTHEALHKAHQQWAPTVFEKRLATSGTHPGWSNAEEEFTITGRDRAFPAFPHSTFTENTARIELGLQPRNSHRSVSDDLPSDMTAAEYTAHRHGGQAPAAAGVMTFDMGNSSSKPRKPPARFQKK